MNRPDGPRPPAAADLQGEGPGATALARRIEHAVLAPQATEEDVAAGVLVALRWGVRALVVKPCHVHYAAGLLAGTSVRTVAVIGFPHGGQTAAVKAFEAAEAVEAGAEELDMVANVGALRQGKLAEVFGEIRDVVLAAAGRPVKVILEVAYLDDRQKRLAARLAARAGAAYVKTGTGFASGAAPGDVALLRRTLSRRIGVKAAGGIRSYAAALALLEAGADLLGTSHTEAILEEAWQRAA